MGQAESQSLGVAIGARVREWREANGKRQADLAATARRHYGLNWTQATVAAIERGQRQLGIEEFLALPFILNTAEIRAHEGDTERLLELADLLPSSGLIMIFPGRYVEAIRLSTMAQGKFGEMTDPEKDLPPEFRAAHRKMQRAMRLKNFTEDSERMEAIQHISPGAEKNLSLLTKVEGESQDEAERQAARKLGVSPFAIALAARKLWNHSLTTERERLLDSQIYEGMPLRRVQALRGHITRSLLTQIEPLVAELRDPSR